MQIEVYRGDAKKPDTIWTYEAYFNDKANVVFDYGGADPWHDKRFGYETQTDDRVVFMDDLERIDITLKDSSDKMQLNDAMVRNFLKRVKDQYK